MNTFATTTKLAAAKALFSAKAIRALRGKETQAAFAKRFGVGAQTVYYWERGMRKPGGPAARLLTQVQAAKSKRVKLSFVKEAPAKSMAQQRFMGAELRRAREGEETVTGMSVKKLRAFARIPKKKRGKLPEVVKPKKASIIKHALYGHEMAFQRRVRATPKATGYPKAHQKSEAVSDKVRPVWSQKPVSAGGWRRQIVDVGR
jgi:DNA-binding transcriptional regulator YiaG